MSNGFVETEKECCNVIRQFLGNEISVEDFCSEFTTLWLRFRDEQEQVKQAWAEPYDQKLIEAQIRGELSNEEFSQAYMELWGLTSIMDFCELIDSVHSACSAFNPTPTYEWEIGEAQLRSDVQQALVKYEGAKSG